MRRFDAFSSCHPGVRFLFFGLVVFFSMCLMHPACLLISFGSALALRLWLSGPGAVGRTLRLLVPLLLLTALINPAFNHRGVTILWYLPSGNPVTLESVLYGLASATLLLSVVLWFSCYTEMVTSDQFLTLFGRLIPSLSLLLSMTLRFVPRFTVQLKQVAAAQRGLGRDLSKGPLRSRLRTGGTVLSILITWSLENAIETADSMKSRGYGLPGRTAYTLYTLDSRDRGLLLWLAFCGVYLLVGWRAGCFTWRYFPMILWGELTPFSLTFPLCYLALCLTPLILTGREDLRWKH